MKHIWQNTWCGCERVTFIKIVLMVAGLCPWCPELVCSFSGASVSPTPVMLRFVVCTVEQGPHTTATVFASLLFPVSCTMSYAEREAEWMMWTLVSVASIRYVDARECTGSLEVVPTGRKTWRNSNRHTKLPFPWTCGNISSKSSTNKLLLHFIAFSRKHRSI